MPTALITGITGQDGSYLAEFLLQKNYRVLGIVHPESTVTYEYINPIKDQITTVNGDVNDEEFLARIIEKYKPNEIYNLAAFSFPPASWNYPVLTGEITAIGVTRLLETIHRVNPGIRFYQASSSEIFGNPREVPQRETTPFCPRNPYGVAKVYGHWITVNYRETMGLYAVSGILFNHESPRRGLEYVTRKIANGAARIKLGLAKDLQLGNLAATRDWGFAGDYVKAMWLMLQRDEPEDFVVGTGQTHSVREFCDIAFRYVGLNYQDYVVVDPNYYRPTEENSLVANPAKARQKLGWKPSVDFKGLVHTMVEADLEQLARQK
ncbi:MAG: GDP-mannose 4,6-dehydratase [Anaerolineales bacterium]|nr:GDP-mannose 4,6-dehydratase [Anaerolineales bacterium]